MKTCYRLGDNRNRTSVPWKVRWRSHVAEWRTNVRTILDRSLLASMIVGLLFVSACAKRPVTAVRQLPAPALAQASPSPSAQYPTPAPTLTPQAATTTTRDP